MRRYDRITPEGTRDYLFKECKIKRKAERSLASLYEKFGYDEVMTPALEFYDVFSDGVGRVSQNELYTLTDSSGRLLTMRPDSTKPIARLFASKLTKANLPLRLYYNQEVFRRNIKLSKKSDETAQIGVELLGSDSFKSDIEIILLAAKSMKLLFGDNFLMEIGHMGFIKSLLDDPGISDKDGLRRALATKNYPELYYIAEKAGEKAAVLKELSGLFGGEEVLEKAKKLFSYNGAGEAVSKLEELIGVLKENGLEQNIIIDLAVINEYEYYTGIVFKGFVRGRGAELLSGGRYDTLYKDYSLNIPAVGFAVNLNEAIAILLKEGSQTDDIGNPNAVVYFDSGNLFNLDKALSEYQSRSIRFNISPYENLEETRAYAKRMGASIILINDEKGIREEKV